MNYQETDLWKSTLGRVGASETERTVLKDLVATYEKFFARASQLASRISADLPHLTLHDKDHFNALWTVADTLVDEQHDLNPLEVFILGGAILLHDSGNTVAAYDGGFSEVKATPQWKDAEAEVRNSSENFDGELTAADEQLILLFTLRHIHAERAGEMHKFAVEVGGDKLFLIENSDLTRAVGELIGIIAASHHWNVDELPSRLRLEVGPPPNMPTTWIIRPVLLACILRCADSCQLDASRAPAFLQGLVRPSDGSVIHWDAQSKLNTPTILQSEAETLLFTSSSAFGPADAKAWWIAGDLIRNADRELVSCDVLLRDLKLPPLSVRRIAGAVSPERLSKHVEVTGWQPVDARIKASNVARVIDLFGGGKLYGNSALIPLRELIQNAADSVRHRRTLDNGDVAYRGRITIRIRKQDDELILEVDDDGLGMSQDVLTGPLIDFTSSYLTSSIVKSEYPGLIGERTRRSGRFGIGFFSVFMLSDDVSVTSRQFGSSISDARTLKFEGGVAVRPLLIEEIPTGYGSATSTRVTIPIKESQFDEIKTTNSNRATGEKTVGTLEKVVANIAPLIDVDIYVDNDGEIKKVHSENWHEMEPMEWLREISLSEKDSSDPFVIALEKIAEKLDFVDPLRVHLGRAVIAPMAGDGGFSIDGLNSTRMMGQAQNEFCGIIDKLPHGPQRHSGDFVDRSVVASWADRQAEQLDTCDLDNREKYLIATRVAKFGGDASPIATIRMNGDWVDLRTVYEKLKNDDLYAPVSAKDSRKSQWQLSPIRIVRPGISYGVARSDFNQNVDVIEPSTTSGNEPYLSVTDDEKDNSLSFISLLQRFAIRDGRTITTEQIDNFLVATYTGEESRYENFYPGMEMKMTVLKIQRVNPSI